MAFPANLTTVTVVGSFITPEGTASTGTVTFTASSWLTNSGANLSIPNSAVTKTLGTAGNFSATIPITDDADISPTGWVYTVAEVVDGVSRSYDVTIPGTVVAGGTVYLADLTPAAAAGPEYYSLASSLSIGTVSTLAAGSAATATITGLAPNQTLNLGIPTGPTGAAGSAATIAVGSTSSVSNSGTAAVTNVGSSSAGTFNFVLRDGPTGPTGATGATGPQGPSATIAVGSTSSVANSGTAAVTNVGSSTAGTFNFVLRDGPTGATGPQGNTGTLAVGSVTSVPNSGTATITNVGSSTAGTFDFVLRDGPTGPQGATGATGATGPAASLGAVTPQALGVAAAGSSGTASREDHVHSSTVANPTITGVLTTAAGTVSAPAITPTGDSNTGIFFPAADTVAIAEGGVEVLRLNSSGQAEFTAGSAAAPAITTTGDLNTGISFPASDAVQISTGGTGRLYVNSTGSVGLGTTGPTGRLFIVTNATSGDITSSVRSDTLGDATRFFFNRRSAANGATPNNANVASLIFDGLDSNGSYAQFGSIQAVIGSNAAGGAPSSVSVYTSASGGTNSERMRIDSNGLITGTGTSLGAWTTASYTPTVGGTGWAIGNGTVTAGYCQVGKIVHFRVRIVFGSTSTFGAGAAVTVTAPVTSRNAGAATTIPARLLDSSLGTTYNAFGSLAINSTTITIRSWDTDNKAADTSSTVPFTWDGATADEIILIGSYEAA